MATSTATAADKAAILEVITNLLSILKRGTASDHHLTAARSLLFGPGTHVVKEPSTVHIGTITEAFDYIAKRWQARPGGIPEHYHRIPSDGPKPEVYQYEDQMAVVWTPYESVEMSDESVGWRAWLVVTLLKPGFAHTMPSKNMPFAAVSTEMLPALAHLMDFPDSMRAGRHQADNTIGDFFLPQARVVRHRAPNMPAAVGVQELVQTFLASLPASAAFDRGLGEPTVRISADGLALVVVPFTTKVEGKVDGRGQDVLVAVEQDGEWRLVDVQVYAVPDQ
jgi:hypothetical protein